MEGRSERGALPLVLVLAVMVAGGASVTTGLGRVGSVSSVLPVGSRLPAAGAPAVNYRSGTTSPFDSKSISQRPGSGGSPSGDPYAIVTSVRVGAAPSAVAYDSGKGQIFVANANTNNVSVISETTSTVVATVSVGLYPSGLAYDSGRAEVFVANSGSDNVSVVSDTTDHVVATVAVGTGPTAVAYDSGKGQVFVTNGNSNTVSVIADSNNTVVATVPVGLAPSGIAYDSGTGQVFVTNLNSNTVSIISDTSDSVVGTVSVGLAPFGAAYDPATSEVFVANFNSSSVSVIPDVAGGIVTTVAVGSGPLGVAYGPGTGQVFVTNAKSANVSVIADANHTVVASVGLFLGGSAAGVAYDSGNHGWYVVDALADVVAVIAPGYVVTFTETGLPGGTSWVMWVNGTTGFGTSRVAYSSSLTTLRAVEPNGTYAFAVLRVPGYGASPSTGSITVAGAPVGQSITFSFLYSVTFTETGLPAGTNWSVTLAGTAKSSSTTSITFAEGNGSHAFDVGAVDGYSANPSSGNVAVNGTAASQAITFTPASSGTGSPLPIILAVVAAVVVIGAVVVVLMRRRKVPPKSGAPPPADPGMPPS